MQDRELPDGDRSDGKIVNWAKGVPEYFWSVIFARLQPGLVPFGAKRSNQALLVLAPETHAYLQYHQLRRVCRSFHGNFKTHSFLVINLQAGQFEDWCRIMNLKTVDLETAAELMSCLTAYRQQQYIETSLLQLPVKVRSVCLGNPSTKSVDLLSAFTALRYCKLHQPKFAPVSLEALSSLKHLDTLSLQHGTFTDLDLWSSVTTLALAKSTAICKLGGSTATQLRELDVNNGAQFLLRCRSSALAMCTHLSWLEMVDTAGAEQFHVDRMNCLAAMGQMPQLTLLIITLDCKIVYLDWFPPSLVSLTIFVRRAALRGSAKHLTALTELTVEAKNRTIVHGREQQTDLIKLQFKWLELPALQWLILSGPVSFAQSILDIAKLPHIRILDFDGVEPCGGQSKGLMGKVLKTVADKLNR